MDPVTGHEGPLAEFDALRREIEARIAMQHQIFTLQLTTAGAIFGLVLSKQNLWPIVLIVPVTSFLFAGSYLSLHLTIRQAARYIEGELSPRVPGGLHWEVYFKDYRKKVTQPLVSPFYLAFPGVSVLAVGLGAWEVSFDFAQGAGGNAGLAGRSAACLWLAFSLVITWQTGIHARTFVREDAEQSAGGPAVPTGPRAHDDGGAAPG